MPEPVRLNAWDRGLLTQHLEFYLSLETGERIPATEAQRHFVAVCRGGEPPRTQHEIAFSRYRQLHPDAAEPAAARSRLQIWRAPSKKAIEVVERIEEVQFEEPTRPPYADTLDRVKALYTKGRAKAADLSTDAALWASTLLSAPDFSRSLERWSSDTYGGLSNVYTQAMDGSFAREGLRPGVEYVSPWLHRLFEGHTPSRAWEAVCEALADDTRGQEFLGFVSAFSSDLASKIGNPVVQLSERQYEPLRRLADTISLPEAWLIDALHYNAVELVASGLPGLALALNWTEPQAEAFARMAGGLGVGASVAANPVLAIVAMAALARAYHRAVQTDAEERWLRGVAVGGAASGAVLASSAFIGGPAWIGLLGGIGLATGVVRLGSSLSLADLGAFVRTQMATTRVQRLGLVLRSWMPRPKRPEEAGARA